MNKYFSWSYEAFFLKKNRNSVQIDNEIFRSEEEIDADRRQKREEKAAWRAKLRPTSSCIDMIIKYLSRIRFVFNLGRV